MLKYLNLFILLLVAEEAYFWMADHYNIIDKPNERSSHSKIVLNGGGIIFMVGVWIWSVIYGFVYPWLLAGVTLVAGVSFIDDIRLLPVSLRLVAQFAGLSLVLVQLFWDNPLLTMMSWQLLMIIAVVAITMMVGAVNIYNFMDGINGMTGGYSITVLVPLLMKNEELSLKDAGEFMTESLLWVVLLSVVVFCLFNFRPKNKAECFAGDVGSIGVASILLFCIGMLIAKTEDPTWLIFLVVYGIDGCLTIMHRIMLHENLGKPHRKHAYQLMANEIGLSHVTVSLIYMTLQLVVSLNMIYVIPDTVVAHWAYLTGVMAVLCIGYVIFMKKYYHLHEDYMKSINVVQC